MDSERIREHLLVIAKPLSRRGERSGQDWLTYNPFIMLWFHLVALEDAERVVGSLAAEFPDARSWGDVGAGSGAYAAAVRRRGDDVVACERSVIGRALARMQGVRSRPFDLRASLLPDLSVDLAYCFEVAEHLPPQLGDRLVRMLAGAAPRVVFTAAAPGQGGTGHLNEQPKDYWIERFQACGKRFDPAAADRLAARWRAAGVTSWWLPQNVMVFSSA